MEGEGERLPKEGAPKGSMTKIIAAVIVIIIVVAAIAGAVLLMGGKVVENKNPTVLATADTTTIIAGESVTFDASDSTDTDGQIVQYIWNFGDGSTDNVAGAVVTHTYEFPGKYLVTVTAVDDKGGRTTNWNSPIRVEVLHPPVEEIGNGTAPYAVAATSGDVIESGTKVDFDASSSAAYAIIWSEDDEAWVPLLDSSLISLLVWNFGDGTVISGTMDEVATVNHTYVGNGSVYASWLAVTSINGAAQMYFNTVIVLPEEVLVPVAIKNPDTYIVATIGEPESLDPAYDYESAGGEILQNVYETLVWYDGEYADRLIPMLATNVPTIENGGVTPDGLHYTFHIRQGVKFHDGTTMDAYDVEYSFERVLIINDDWGPAWMMGQVMIPDYGHGPLDMDAIDASVEVLDQYTVRINLVQPYPAFIQVLAYTVASIVSMDYVEAHGGVQVNQLNEWMHTHEAGTGPFKLKEWVSNQYIMLERFDDYWREPAKLKYVIIKKVQDVGTREMMLFSGDADSVYIPRQHKTDVEGKPGLRIIQGKPTFNIDFIGFNQDIRPGPNPIGNVSNWFFKDVYVRKAFVHAFNYDKFLSDVLLGTGIQPRGAIPKGMFGYNESVPLFDYNLTKSAYYLKLAINNVTGRSYADEGFEIWLYYNAGNAVREAACEMFKVGLESLSTQGLVNGTIIVNVQALDWSGAYLPAVRGRQLPIFFLGWAPDYADPDDYTYPFYHENGTYAYRIGLQNHTLSLMVENAARELNTTLRAQMYYEIEMAVYENAYFAWLAQATNFHVERDWTQGYYFNPMFSGMYYYPIYKA
ncbi:MAG: ABC transporter substrate-binding protein [Methanomassiliicoccales archaeon]|nr:ABC transporter substrate-binding protein [Methanomassiliicoccales archaeon]